LNIPLVTNKDVLVRLYEHGHFGILFGSQQTHLAEAIHEREESGIDVQANQCTKTLWLGAVGDCLWFGQKIVVQLLEWLLAKEEQVL